MSGYAIITQNDESAWDDVKGDLYHYPATYQAILTVGCPNCHAMIHRKHHTTLTVLEVKDLLEKGA